MTSKEESLGVKASKLAQVVASKWLDDAWTIIQKKVLDTANRGLFHATVRFTDIVPQDPQNQIRLLKILEREQLKGKFTDFVADGEKDEESGVTLTITWGNEFL
mmetsp:Transcript_8662/g.14928  ORF Transcript_8662/g.14928 Transcript_8662/m.14928 type:complete len:104 (+) Transcript_8662:33-344(+)